MDNSSNTPQSRPSRSTLPSRPAHPNRPGRIPIATFGLDTSGSPFGLPDLPLPFRRTNPPTARRYQGRPGHPTSSESSDSDEQPTYEEELQAELALRAFRPQNRPYPANRGLPVSPATRRDIQDHRLLARRSFDSFFANRVRRPVFRPIPQSTLLAPRPISPPEISSDLASPPRLPRPTGAANPLSHSPPSLRDSTRPAVDSRSLSRSSSLPPPPVTPQRSPWGGHQVSLPGSPGTPPGSLERREPVLDRLAEDFSQLGAVGGLVPAWTLPREVERERRPLSPHSQVTADARRIRIERRSRLIFFAILAVKERRPEANADQLWLDFVAKLIGTGVYSDVEEVRSAWHFIFREPPRPLFAYFVTGSLEESIEKVDSFGLFLPA